MDERGNPRRYRLVVVVAVAALLTSVASVIALAQPNTTDDVFTGCVNENSGTLRGVAVGFDPVRPCSDRETQITWDRAGPGLAALEERIAQQTIGAPSPVELVAAATVDVTTIKNSVGPIESVTQVGPAHYRVGFGDDVFGEDVPHSTAFISLASNSAFSNPSPCTYEVYAADKLDILCWDLPTGQPEDAEWSLMVFAVPTP